MFGIKIYVLNRKKQVLSPDDVQLPWKPLFDLCSDAFSHKYKLNRDDPNLQNTLESLVKAISPYFPVSLDANIF